MAKSHLRFLPLVLPWALLPAPVRAQGDAPLELTLKRAVEIALAPDGNVRMRLVEETRRQAAARSAQVRSLLLPNVSASVGQLNQTRNLTALGLGAVKLPFGLKIPEVVGPYDVLDARGTATQTIFDFSTIRRYQASRSGVQSVDADRDATRDSVTHQVASAYLAALRAEAGVEAVKANVELAESLRKLAENQKAAGTGTGIEVTRAQVVLANERQRLLVSENERRQAHLRLLRVIGAKLGTALALSEKLSYIAQETIAPEKALQVAADSRSDLRAQQKRETTAKLNHSASVWERLPSLVGEVDYGTIGKSINHALPTRTFGAQVRLPVFDGGRLEARRSEARSQYEQERIRTADLRKQVELEIRLALDSLRSSDEQVKVAADGLTQVQSELEQAQRRYQAGVASSLEVVDAQTRLARARDNHIAALYLYNQARIDLGQAMGTIRRMID